MQSRNSVDYFTRAGSVNLGDTPETACMSVSPPGNAIGPDDSFSGGSGKSKSSPKGKVKGDGASADPPANEDEFYGVLLPGTQTIDGASTNV